MEKENVLEIEFKEVWDNKWAWRIIKNEISFSKELKEIKFKGVKMMNTHKHSLFLLDSFEDEYVQLEEFELILIDEKLELEDFVKYVNQKYRKPKRWRAEIGEHYYSIDFDRSIIDMVENEDDIDNTVYTLGNYFETKEEAINIANSKEWKEFWEKVKNNKIGEN